MMRYRGSAVRTLIYILIFTTTALFAQPAYASLAPSGVVADGSRPAAARAADMKVISTALESKVLRAKLKGLGLSEAETEARLKNLSDEEIHQLASRIEAVHPGGVIVELLVIIALVLVVLYLLKRV